MSSLRNDVVKSMIEVYMKRRSKLSMVEIANGIDASRSEAKYIIRDMVSCGSLVQYGGMDKVPTYSTSLIKAASSMRLVL